MQAVPAPVVFIGLLIVVVILLAISVKVLEGELAVASESAYTQAHGASRAATVISVTSNGSNSGSEIVAASLASPAGGQQTTTVHVPSTQSFPAGAALQVLIDPQDPGYAELPGQRYTTASTAWGTAAAFWLIAALLMLLMIPAARSWGRQRRRRASPSAATGTLLPARMRGISAGDRYQPGVHEVAQAVALSSRVVYVDNNPVVLTHARALLISGGA